MKHLLCLLWLLCLPFAWSQCDDWTQFQNDMRRSNPCETTLSVTTVGGLTQRWSYKTEGWIWSSPAIAGGVVYIGSNDGKVYAFDAPGGTLLWSFLTGGLYTIVQASPAVANGIVYAGSYDPNPRYPRGELFALNALNGTLLWSHPTGDIDSSPTVANGIVYAFGEDGGGALYALDASTGELLWSYAVTGSPSVPAVANGIVYFGSRDQNIYALDANQGTLVWSYTTGAPIKASPVVANGIVYIGSEDGYFYALNAQTGAMSWRYFASGNAAVANGIVYLAGSKLYVLNAVTGKPKRIHNTMSGASPAVANGLCRWLHPNEQVRKPPLRY